MELFKKSIVVGVSVTPEVGLEVAQIDYASQLVLKYGARPLEYDVNRRIITDMDLFKEALQDLFMELQIPKSADIVINIPAPVFKVGDYPAALDENTVSGAIEEEFADFPLFQSNEPNLSLSKLPSSSIQFNKYACVLAQRIMLVEMAMIVKELGYHLIAIDTSVASTFNALIYNERLNVENDANWVMLVVESFCCRVFSMQGKNLIDAFEERISIGEVLGDAENYNTVIATVTPLLKNLPSSYLCVVSKTNIISAEILAGKLNYSAPIIHQEANSFSREAFMQMSPDADQNLAVSVSLDVIGAAIYRDFAPNSSFRFNLFNRSLGEIYLQEQPPEIVLGDLVIVLSNENLLKAFAVIAVVLLIPALIGVMFLNKSINEQKMKQQELDAQIAKVNQYLKDNENISTDLFDEGDEVRAGLGHNKQIYSYYTIVGTEIPKKLWLTHLKLSGKTTIEGQADNLESVYAFFRSIKDYAPDSGIKLQKLGLATSNKSDFSATTEFDTDAVLTSLNADFYEFRISDEPEVVPDGQNGSSQKSGMLLPDITDIKE